MTGSDFGRLPIITDEWITQIFQGAGLPEDSKEAERMLLRIRQIIDHTLAAVRGRKINVSD